MLSKNKRKIKEIVQCSVALDKLSVYTCTQQDYAISQGNRYRDIFDIICSMPN